MTWLRDLRVVAVEQYGAGPWATMQLADLGAEVIKVEDPHNGGDVARYVPPFQVGQDSLFFESFNRGKRSIALDLKNPAGRSVFEDLVRESDALFANLRGDAFGRLRLGFEDLRHVNPQLVCCSLSGFGLDGPRAAQGAYDHVLQALAGWMALTGGADQPPTKSGLSLVDFCGGYVAAIAILAGVWRARRDGEGLDCDLSLFETALAQLNYIATWASRGFQPQRLAGGAHQSLVPFQTLATADGWIVVACPKQSIWERFCEAIGSPELLSDERFADFASRLNARTELVEELEAKLGTAPTDHWLERCRAHSVPAAPVQDVAEAIADPQNEARDALASVKHPRLGEFQQVRNPIRGASDSSPPMPLAPGLGSDSNDVLAEICGYDPGQIAEVGQAGAFGPSHVKQAS